MTESEWDGRESNSSMRDGSEGNGSDSVFNTVLYAVGALVLALVGWGMWRVWDVATSPTISLKKTEWNCTDRRNKYLTETGRYGNVHTHVITTCYQYSKTDAPAMDAAVE
jgi:hypothetical protein